LVILLCSQYDSYRKAFRFAVLLISEIVEVHVHVPDIAGIGSPGLKINEHEALPSFGISTRGRSISLSWFIARGMSGRYLIPALATQSSPTKSKGETVSHLLEI
jgi:hypothetical protein